MALEIRDRVKETCTGTDGDMTLTGAMSGFVGFDLDDTLDGDTIYYALEDADGTKWEVGLGTLSADSTTIARTTILATQVSFTDTTRQTFSGGTHTIFATYPASRAVYLDADGATSFNLTDIPDFSFGGTNLTGTILVNESPGTSPRTGVLTGDNQYNVGIGYYALSSITNADTNVAIGHFANRFLTTGYKNVSIGTSAGEQMTTGARNIQIGDMAHQYANDGKWNVAIGQEAMRGNSDGTSTTENYNNVAIGNQALSKLETGDQNIAIGVHAGEAVTTGSSNILLGAYAGDDVTTEGGMLYIGYQATASDGTFIKGDMYGRHLAIGMADDHFLNSAGSPTLQVYPEDAADEAIFVKMPTSHSSNLIQIQNSSGTDLFVVDSTGEITTGSISGGGGSGDMTGVDLTGGVGISIDSETNTTSGAYSSTITCNLEGTELASTGETGTTKFLRVDGDGTCSWQVPPDTDTTYTKASFDIDHLFTLVGASDDADEHLGTFTGSTIADNQTIKAAIQAVETAVETKGATAGSSSIVTVGTISSGTWQGTQIASAYIADNSITLAKLAGGTDGQIITFDANGDPVAVGPGTDGQILTSTGAGSPPAFEDPASGASNITGLSDALVEDNSIYLGNDPSSTTSTAERNIAIGSTALDAVTTADDNIAIGYNAGTAITTNTSSKNILIGSYAGENLTTGSDENVFIGYEAGHGLADNHSQSVVIGYHAGYSETDDRANYLNNVHIGYKAGMEANNQNAVHIGVQAGQYNAGNQSVAIGGSALAGSSSSAIDAWNSIAVGYGAGGSSTGDNCIYLGRNAGKSNTSDKMLFIGWDEPTYNESIIKADMDNKHVAVGVADSLAVSAGSPTFQVYTQDAADPAFYAKMAGSHSGNLIEIENSSGTDIFVVNSSGQVSTGTWQGTAIAQAYIANDAINGDKIADDAVDSEHYAAGSIDEEHLNATNTPTNNYLLSYDDTSGGFTWVAAGSGGENNEYSFKTISVSGQDDVVADTTTDTLTLAAGSNVTITTTAASDTVTIAATDTNTTYSAATSSALGLVKIEDDTEQSVAANAVSATASRTYGIQLNSSDQAVVNVPWTDTDNNTTYTGGTNLTLDGTTFNVDDAFLKNDASDSTTGTITAGGFTTTGTWTFDEFTSGTVGITTVQDSGTTFDDNDTSLMTAAAIADKIEAYGYSTTAGDITGVTAGTGLSGGGASGAVTLNVDASQTQITAVGTIGTGVWQGTAIAHAYIGADAIDGDNIADDSVNSEHYVDGSIDTAHIGDDQVTYAKIQNVSSTDRILGRDSAGAGVIEEITPANLRTMINVEDGATADQTKSDIDGLAITTVGTIDTGTWQGTAIAHAYIGNDAIDGDNIADDAINSEHYVDGSIDTAHIADDQVTYAKVQNVSATSRVLGRITSGAGVIEELTGANIRTIANVEDGATADQTKSDIDGLAITTVGTIDTGVWQGTAIAHAYIGADAIDGDNIADDAVNSEHYVDGSIDTAHIADDQVTYAKIQNVSATDRILGRDSAGAGVIEEITPANLRTMLNVEDGATADQTKSDIDGLAITTVGTIDTGTWQATDVAVAHGGTGASSAADARSNLGITYANIGTVDISANTNLAAGTNISLSGDTLNVDDAFLKNDADDTTSGTVTMANLIVGDAGNIGSASDTDAIAIASDGEVTLSQRTTFSKAVKTPLKSNTDGATVTFNLDEASTHTVTLGDNRTLAISNEDAGQKFIINLVQDGTGSRTVTWFSTIKWAGGSAPTLTTTANKADSFGFLCTGTDAYYGFVIGQNI